MTLDRVARQRHNEFTSIPCAVYHVATAYRRWQAGFKTIRRQPVTLLILVLLVQISSHAGLARTCTLVLT